MKLLRLNFIFLINFAIKDNMYDDDESESGSGWISWFCDLEGHEFFIEVNIISIEIIFDINAYDRWMRNIFAIILTCMD